MNFYFLLVLLKEQGGNSEYLNVINLSRSIPNKDAGNFINGQTIYPYKDVHTTSRHQKNKSPIMQEDCERPCVKFDWRMLKMI